MKKPPFVVPSFLCAFDNELGPLMSNVLLKLLTI